MKLLFEKLIKGISRQDIPKKYQVFVNDLIKKRIIKAQKRASSEMLFLHKDYIVGTMDISKHNTGFLKPLGSIGDKDIIVESEHLYKAIKNDLVIAKKDFRKSKMKARIEIILQNNFDYSIVYLHKTSSSNIQALNILSKAILPIMASQKSLKLLPDDCLLKIKNSDLSIVEVLGVMSDAFIDEKISLCLYNKKEEFTKKSELEASSFGKNVDKNMYQNRVDLTNLPFCTIDPVTAKDHDDAIYFNTKENILYIAIADVSEYVNEFSSLDEEAKDRGFSIYFPHKSIPMLPRSLSENICSLKEGVDRLSFVCKIYFDKNDEIIKEEFIQAIINVHKKYSYEDIDSLLEKRDKIDDIFLKDLFSLFDKTQIIKKKRLLKGLTFQGEEIKISLDKNMEISNVSTQKETSSHSLVEECMLLANKASAKAIGKYGIFRTHQSPSASKIQDLLVTLHTIGIKADYNLDTHKLITQIQKKADEINILPFVDKLLIQTQKQAKYTKTDTGHFGLGFDNYTHFTSPIRRYSDLILHRILKSIIYQDKKRHKYIINDIEFVCDNVSTLERESAKVQYDFEDRKFARFANKNIGLEIEGIVVDTNKSPIIKMQKPFNGARIFLENYSYDLSLFCTIKAVITKVDMFNSRIYADEIGI